jgi:23S rRNA pseudouridine1911/1915/1917 synthase
MRADATRQEPATWDVVVAPEAAGTRLDRFLSAQATANPPAEAVLSRSRLQALIEAGAVSRLGLAGESLPAMVARAPVKAGERYRIVLPAPTAAVPKGERIPLIIVHEDRDLIVIDKPAGLVVHPAAGHATGTLVNALIAHCGDSLSGIGGVARPGIVHRLDKDTSGLLVVAKTDPAHQRLSAQFAAHGADGRLQRRYLALAWGAPERPTGALSAALARSRTHRTRIAVVRDEAGRHATTHWESLAHYHPAGRPRPLVSLLRLTLETGRTHQIRVHLAHAGHPVLGDPTYGSSHKTAAAALPAAAQAALTALRRQALHAAELGFEHPRSGKALLFHSALPADIQHLADALGLRPPAPRRR